MELTNRNRFKRVGCAVALFVVSFCLTVGCSGCRRAEQLQRGVDDIERYTDKIHEEAKSPNLGPEPVEEQSVADD